MATNKPQTDYQKQGVRIPKDLHARIHEAAAASGRSYNSELIARLEASFAPSGHGEAIFQLHAHGEGGPLEPVTTPSTREISERLDKLENDLKLIVAGVKGGRFGKVSAAEETDPKKKP